MAKVRVRALQRGFDGQVRREPGDEFDYDIERQGQGRWFEVVNEPTQQARTAKKTVTKKRAKKKASKKRRASDDDLLA